MSEWRITASWDIEPKPAPPVAAPTKFDLKAKPIDWMEWYQTASFNGYAVRELFYTDSGYYGAYDKETKKLKGGWVDRDGGLGYLDD